MVLFPVTLSDPIYPKPPHFPHFVLLASTGEHTKSTLI